MLQVTNLSKEYPTARGPLAVLSDVVHLTAAKTLNGKAVRVLHSINDGVYGGESIIVWDEKKKSLVYYYFTTAGFYTTGTMTLSDGKYASHEVVAGSAEGITEVRAMGELRADGTMHSKSEYLKEGKWVPGHEVTYKEDAKAEVVFK